MATTVPNVMNVYLRPGGDGDVIMRLEVVTTQQQLTAVKRGTRKPETHDYLIRSDVARQLSKGFAEASQKAPGTPTGD